MKHRMPPQACLRKECPEFFEPTDAHQLFCSKKCRHMHRHPNDLTPEQPQIDASPARTAPQDVSAGVCLSDSELGPQRGLNVNHVEELYWAWHAGFARGEVSGMREQPLNPYIENPFAEEFNALGDPE